MIAKLGGGEWIIAYVPPDLQSSVSALRLDAERLEVTIEHKSRRGAPGLVKVLDLRVVHFHL